MSRNELLRVFVRAHQRLVERRLQSTRTGAPADPQIDRDLVAIAERVATLLSNREQKGPELETAGAGDEHLSEESAREMR